MYPEVKDGVFRPQENILVIHAIIILYPVGTSVSWVKKIKKEATTPQGHAITP